MQSWRTPASSKCKLSGLQMTITRGSKVEMFHEGGAPEKIRMKYEQASPDHVVGYIIVRTIVAQVPATLTIS